MCMVTFACVIAFFFFNDTATTEIYTLSLHDALPILETPFGRKRRIDQSACNQDFSCVEGFCPSFVTLERAEPAKPATKGAAAVGDLPDPVLPEPGADGAWNILLAGVGGQIGRASCRERV